MRSPGPISLGDVEPARSRHAGRRSAVVADDGLVVVGTANGRVRGFDAASFTERWSTEGPNGFDSVGGDDSTAGGDSDPSVGRSVVSLATTAELVIAGERGKTGRVRAVERASGQQRWEYQTAIEIGDPVKQTRFFLPFVVDVATVDDRIYVAARRYERDGQQRQFESVICAFTPEGDVCWRYRADASAIAVAADDARASLSPTIAVPTITTTGWPSSTPQTEASG